MKEILRELGLTEHEIKIYLVLLDKGPNQAGKITRLTGIHRRNVYDCLERLIQKGLIGYIKTNNKREYMITNPKTILEKLNQRRRDLKEVMPELIQKYQTTKENNETLFFRGKKGINLVLNDQLECKKEIMINATTVSVNKILNYYFPKYQLIRKEKKIKTRMIFDEEFKNKKNRINLDKLPLCKHRYIKNFNRSPMSQYIYGNNVAIILWSEEPIAVLIRQKEIAQGFRDNFEVLWNVAKP